MKHSKTALVLLGVICAAALLLRLEGLYWPKLHPDEPVIGAWLEQAAHNAYIRERVYPNGFFTLARPAVWAQRAWLGARQRAAYWLGTLDRLGSVPPDGIYLGRWLNALCGAAACVVIYLLVLGVTGSAGSGLFSAGLLALAQYAVEHSHYAETDTAALLLLCLAGLLLVKARADGRTAQPAVGSCLGFGLAALTCGFAAGTKFTLVVLLPIVVAEALLNGRGRGWSALKLTGLGLLLFGLGFILANPAVALDWRWFRAGMAAEQQRVFRETALNLGAAGAQPGVKYWHHLKLLISYAQTLGYPWLALMVAGLPLAIFGFARRYWTILFLFPLLFAVYWVFMAPWVRSQEFLLFLPAFAALAALPLAALGRWRPGISGRGLALLLAAAAVGAAGINGWRVAALFGWKDTRLMAGEWLQARLPLDSRLAAETYAEAAVIHTRRSPLAIRKVEQTGLTFLRQAGCDYLLRAATVSGRGLRHPLSGALYPEPQQLWREFSANSELLCAWAPLPARGAATFVSPAIELYGLHPSRPAAALRMTLPQPALLVNCDQNAAGRQTFCPVGRGLGCAAALLIDRFPQTIAVGGPQALTQSVYLVLTTLERPAAVKVKGFGLSRKVQLDPYDAAVVALQLPRGWRPGARPFETVALQAEPVKDIVYIPCFARLVFSADEAVRILLDADREDLINRYFPDAFTGHALSPGMQYLAAARLGLGHIAAQTAPAALAMQAQIQSCLRAGSAAVDLNGNSGYYYDQFARLRWQRPYDFACCFPLDQFGRQAWPDALKELELQIPEANSEAGAGNECLYSHVLAIPALLPPGSYELRGQIMARGQATNVAAAVPLALGAEDFGETSRMELSPGQWRDFTVRLQPQREIRPGLVLHAPVPAQVYLRNLEIVWNLAAALAARRAEFFAAALKPGTAAAADARLAGQRKAIVFAPWVALENFSFNAPAREVTCVFAALRDNTPRLAVNFWILRRGEWRKKQAQALGVKRWLKKGECATLTIRLADAFGDRPDINKIGLGVETDVLWHPGAVPLEDGRRVIAFAALADRALPDGKD